MEKKIFCVACDGKLFQNEDECLKYEGVVEACSKLSNFIDKDGCLFMKRFVYLNYYSDKHFIDIKEEMGKRGLEELIKSNHEIEEWVSKAKDFEVESSPLCKNCEFNCHDKNYQYDFCQLFEEGRDPKEYDQIKSTTFKEDLMKISSFCKEHKDCKDCPFFEEITNNYDEKISYCDIVASIFDLYYEIWNYDDPYYFELFCMID